MKKLLLVDDSRSVRNVVKRAFASDFEITEAVSGQEAIGLFEQNSYDLVILDVEMPGINGFETCQRFREIEDSNKEKKTTPIVFFTGRDTVESRMKGFEVGATEFLKKDHIDESMKSIIDRIVNPEKKYSALKVLVVDDSRVVRRAIVACLEPFGIDIVEKQSGKEAFDYLKKVPDSVDMIITDHHMPDLTGIELCHKIRQELGLKTVPVIFVSAEVQQENIINFFSSGATDYIQKPFLGEELISRVKAHLETRILYKSLQKSLLDLKNNQKELMESRKMVAMGEMAGGIAHEVNTPLATALLAANMVKSANKNEAAADKMDVIVKSLKKVSKITTALASFAQGDFFKTFEQVNVADLFTDFKDQYDSQSNDKEIKLDYELVVSMDDQIHVNRSSFYQILSALIENSVEATKKLQERWVSIKTQKAHQEPFLEIYVEDPGGGISPEVEEKMYQPFFTTKAVGDGEGLGLSMAKRSLEKWGGSISYLKERDNTCFLVRLPLEQNHEEKKAA